MHTKHVSLGKRITYYTQRQQMNAVTLILWHKLKNTTAAKITCQLCQPMSTSNCAGLSSCQETWSRP